MCDLEQWIKFLFGELQVCGTNFHFGILGSEPSTVQAAYITMTVLLKCGLDKELAVSCADTVFKPGNQT